MEPDRSSAPPGVRFLALRTPWLASALEEVVRGEAVEDPLWGNVHAFAACAAVAEPVELVRRVRVAVDREHAAHFDGQAQQPARRVAAFWPAVDLHRNPVVAAGAEHVLGVERRLGPATA